MKRNLLKGIVLISVIALSSCSTTSKLAGTQITDDDDVYYTKAKAGDQMEYADANYQQDYNNNYNGDDEYYYYGDYASRINRFNYFSPFEYDDNFYYDYSPYSNYGLNLDLGFNSYAYSPYGFGGLYSPFDYGYGLGFYDGLGYGGYYSSYGYGYGGGRGHHFRQQARPGYAGGSALTNRGIRTGAGRLAPGGGYYPRRPGDNTAARQPANGAVRGVRPQRDVRPAVQQTVERAPSIAPSNSSSGGGGGSSGGGGGGGGRPVRP